MTARRGSSMLMLAAAVLAAACSDPTAPATDVSGRWAGTMTHPSYDGGSLTLTLTDTNGAVEGTYKLIMSKGAAGGRVLVQQSSGQVSGSASDGGWSLLMQRSGGDVWLLEGSTGRSSASGEWSTEQGVKGSYSVSRD